MCNKKKIGLCGLGMRRGRREITWRFWDLLFAGHRGEPHTPAEDPSLFVSKTDPINHAVDSLLVPLKPT
jgi:hypothetical protein